MEEFASLKFSERGYSEIRLVLPHQGSSAILQEWRGREKPSQLKLHDIAARCLKHHQSNGAWLDTCSCCLKHKRREKDFILATKKEEELLSKRGRTTKHSYIVNSFCDEIAGMNTIN